VKHGKKYKAMLISVNIIMKICPDIPNHGMMSPGVSECP